MTNALRLMKEGGADPDALLLGCRLRGGGNLRGVASKTEGSIVAAFDEDKALLEKMQAQIRRDPWRLEYPEVTLGTDSAGVKVRQVLHRKLAAEGRSL